MSLQDIQAIPFRKGETPDLLSDQHPHFAAYPISNDPEQGFEEDMSGSAEEVKVILFLFLGLLIGALTNYILSRRNSKIPYSVIMFLEGLLYGYIMKHFYMDDLSDSMKTWAKVESDILLYMFLPVLTFSDAMSLSWYTVKDFFLQSLLFAAPGVILTTIIMGSLAKALPLSWSWTLATLFGTVVSATDPVASVAILKHAGASPSLIILILGESLMSEAGAAVLYHLFSSRLEGHYESENIASFLLKDFLFSPIIGIAFGILAVRVMKFADQRLRVTDTIMQIILTLCCAYLCFFTAQYSLTLSGVVACCGAGIVMGTLGPPIILNHEAMHSIWEVLEWTANSLIFLIAGLIIARKAASHGRWIDFAYVLLLYLTLVITRFVIVAGVTPLVQRTGPEFTTKEASFMGLTGLRGAMGILLTLATLGLAHDHYISHDDADRFIILAGGVIGLTLLVNGTCSPFLLEWCGLGEIRTPEKEIIDRHIKSTMRAHIQEHIEHIRHNFNAVNFDNLTKYSTLLSTESQDEEMRLSDMRNLSNRRTTVLNQSLLKELRTMFLETVKTNYLHYVKIGKLPNHSYSSQILVQSIDFSLSQRDTTALTDWSYVRKELYASPLTLKLLSKLDALLHVVGINAEFADMLEGKYEKRRVYILNSFITAQEDAQHKLQSFLITEGRVSISVLDEIALILKQSQKSVSDAKVLYETLPASARLHIMENQAAKAVLHEEAHYIQHLTEEGYISPKDAEVSMRTIISDVEKLETERKEASRAVQSNFKKRKVILQNNQSVLHGDNSTLEDTGDVYTLYKD